MPSNSDIGEQAISAIAKTGLESQLNEVDKLDVEIKTSPQAFISGELETVAIEGEGLTMQHDLRVEELHVKTGNIAINPFKAAFGSIELTQTAAASAQITLTEADINRAFNSDYLQSKFQTLQVQIEGQPIQIETTQIQFCLTDSGKARLQAAIKPVNTDQQRQIAFTAVPTVTPDGHRIILDQITYENTNTSEQLTAALIASAHELLDIRNFNLEGMVLKINDLEVQKGQLNIEAYADVRKFPKS